MDNRSGFTLIELLIVVAIIAFLAALTVPSLFKMLSKSKRSEAHATLRSLYVAERAYWIEHGKYTTVLGPEGLGWKPEGKLQYTYGFPGSEGVNFFAGELPGGDGLSSAGIKGDGFTIAATADIDGDGKSDVLTVNQSGVITLVQDDLAD